MLEDKMQASRFELKYVINEDLALQVRDFVTGYMDLDRYGVDKPNNAYPVHSLYLDSRDMHCYWATVNGNKNRFKLRVRFYDDEPTSPAFFEIKRRMNNCILKQRGAARRSAVERVLAGFMPEVSDLMSHDPRHTFSFQNFVQLTQQIGARPNVHVAYSREAYMPRDGNSARLTLDRDVRSELQSHCRLTTRMEHPVITWGRKVVLELKFTDRCPDWFGELVRVFDLRQRGAPKYADGLHTLRELRARMLDDTEYVAASQAAFAEGVAT